MARATSGALLPLMRADGIAFAAFARDDGKLLSKYCRASRMIMLTDPLGTLDVLAGCACWMCCSCEKGGHAVFVRPKSLLLQHDARVKGGKGWSR
jgi:hypothetical protein